MATIAPLTPLVYDPTRFADRWADVVAPPYDVIGDADREALLARHVNNVVRLILPQGEGDEKYARAREIFTSWRRDGILRRQSTPAFYRYDQTFEGPGKRGERRTRRGFIALLRLSPFSEGVVLPHERTLSGPKEDRLKLFRATAANLSPGFMLYQDPTNELEEHLATATGIVTFDTNDGISHSVGRVEDRAAIDAIVKYVEPKRLLIADGHHRYETAIRYRDEVEAIAKGAGERAEHRYVMTYLVNEDDPNLLVLPTHRHVHSLASFSVESLVEKASAFFSQSRLDPSTDAGTLLNAVREAGKFATSFGVVTGDYVGVWTLRPEQNLETHPVLEKLAPSLRVTDVAVLHGAILEAILGITKEAQSNKTNLWYPQDATAAMNVLREEGRGQVLFLMNATPVAQVRAVAESGNVMPQKSTFFYPKVLTGLAFHTLDPARTVAC